MQRHLLSWPSGAKLLNHTRLSSQARRTPPVASCDHRSPARRCPPPAAELRALLAERFAAAPAGAWITRLTAAGLSAQVARDVHENMADPVHIARGLSILRDHPELGRICNVGRSRRFSRTPVDPLFAAPPLGCDTRAIVEETGWGARFGQLVADGIVAVKLPAGTPPGQRRPAEAMPAR